MKKVYCSLLSLLTSMLLVAGCSTNPPQNTENSGTASDTKTDIPSESTSAPATVSESVETSLSSRASEKDATTSEPRKENTIITISELCGINKEMLKEKDFSLIYTLYDETSDGGDTEISDKTAVSEIFGLILDTKVHNKGESVDMYVMKYEDFRFNSDGETFSFSFVPDSYFCFNSLYYEICDSKLGNIRDIIEECKISENPDNCWFTDDANFDTVFHDNGDEAPSVTEIVLSCQGKEISGYIEGAYDIISVDRENDCYVVTYTRGDFYSHDKQSQSRITVKNGEMVIENLD